MQFQLTGLGDVFEIEFIFGTTVYNHLKHKNGSPRYVERASTTCNIFKLCPQNGSSPKKVRVATGLVTRYHKDPAVKELGRKHALAKALKNWRLSKADRAIVWVAYRESSPSRSQLWDYPRPQIDLLAKFMVDTESDAHNL